MPSERTIETLSNHALLEIINDGRLVPPFAWMFVPNQNEENYFAYDAGLIDAKRLYIQYKSINLAGSFTFSFRQIWQLCSYLPRHIFPYVFLSGNHSAGYDIIGFDHELGGRYNSFDKTFFIDVWAVLDAMLLTFTGGLLPPQAILPPPSSPCSGDVTLAPNGAFFTTTIKDNTALVDTLQYLCFLLGHFGQTFCGSTGAIPPSGNGVIFAKSVAECKYGRHLIHPLAEPTPVLDLIERVPLDFGRLVVLTVPMI